MEDRKREDERKKQTEGILSIDQDNHTNSYYRGIQFVYIEFCLYFLRATLNSRALSGENFLRFAVDIAVALKIKTR